MVLVLGCSLVSFRSLGRCKSDFWIMGVGVLAVFLEIDMWLR